MERQSAIQFPILPAPKESSNRIEVHRTPSPKRPRAPTSSNAEIRAVKPRKCGPIKSSKAFLFRGTQPLYIREVIKDRPNKMTISCGQPGCKDFEPKVVNRGISGTNNFKTYYQHFHPIIPCCQEDYDELQRELQAANPQKPFFERPTQSLDHNQQYRLLLLEFIIKNNLSFSIVDQPETKALFTFLSPMTIQISRRTLMKDLKARFNAKEIEIKA